MATLLLTAVGTVLGGPIGGAIGALAGRSIDGAIIGGGKREGPRLRELAITTSSYGQPIPRQHGRMRAAGTIIWATELVEHKDKSGGKKGQPSVTTYAYTTSFAVAVSSRPIHGIGRIWADGNLLRGAGGDLKVAGTMRLHTGRGDQQPDPLIAADKGAASPAFRDCAYVVFEDLALADFGNRIPALTFEVLADEGAIALADLIDPLGGAGAVHALAPLAGFANEGGPLAATLETIDTLFPLAVDAGGAQLTVDPARESTGAAARVLPPPARAWEEHDFGAGEGRRHDRDAGEPERIAALRYYDVARDFQPGVQRPAGPAPAGSRSGLTRTIEFPGAFAADDARSLADAAARRSGWRRETLQWRVAELDPALAPGSDVRVPGKPGTWRVETWEWRERGVELGLVRRNPAAAAAPAGDTGAAMPPPDLLVGPTILHAFELPPMSLDAAQPLRFAAAGGTGHWRGAALYLNRAGKLEPIGHTGRSAATIGRLGTALRPSPGLQFESHVALEVTLDSLSGGFVSESLSAVLMGANRLLVGREVLQFAQAAQIGPARWRLTGLLRGRGGTEGASLEGHPAGTAVVLIDDALVALDPALVPSEGAVMLAAIGLADDEPVYADLVNSGAGRRPPVPVHPRAERMPDGTLTLSWVRRARGAWSWDDEVGAPLVEESELYRIGFGPSESPITVWESGTASFSLDAATHATLAAEHRGKPLWVRQVGRFAQSDPLLLTHLT